VTIKQLWTVGGIPMEFTRKDIKNLRIGIYAPDGNVRVAAPRRLDEGTVRRFVISRIDWIVRKRTELALNGRRPGRVLESGEVVYFQGRPHVIEVIERAGAPQVACPRQAILQMRIPAGLDQAGRRALLQGWYQRELRTQLDMLVAKWASRLDITVAEVRIRQMKTRWGSCNARARRIWLNLDLIRKPPRCLEYVVVHELVHFFERGHNERFRDFMDTLLPQWRECRSQLNGFVEA
jgi:predicted metal-dependent hydrolase